MERRDLVLTSAVPAGAQLNTQHLKGTVGLKAGSQPLPQVATPTGRRTTPAWGCGATTYARVAPQGSELTLLATFLVKPLPLPTK